MYTRLRDWFTREASVAPAVHHIGSSSSSLSSSSSSSSSSYLSGEAARQRLVDARWERAGDSYDEGFERLGLHVVAQIEDHNTHLGGGRGGQRRDTPDHLESCERVSV